MSGQKGSKYYRSPFSYIKKMRSVSRISLDRKLIPLLGNLEPGVTLDIGSKMSPYLDHIPHTRYLRLDIDEKNEPDICCDIHEIKWESNYFENVIATEVLEHLYDPARAVNEIHRVLKPGGSCVLSTRFIHKYHPDPCDYYRFTPDSLALLFEKFENVEVIPHGNGFQAVWMILNRRRFKKFLNIFNPIIAVVNFKKTNYPLGYILIAKK